MLGINLQLNKMFYSCQIKSNWLNYLQQDTKLSYRTPLFGPCWGWLSHRERRNLIFSLIKGYCRYCSDIQEISCLMNRHFVTEVQLLVRNNFSSAIYKKWQLKSIQKTIVCMIYSLQRWENAIFIMLNQ